MHIIAQKKSLKEGHEHEKEISCIQGPPNKAEATADLKTGYFQLEKMDNEKESWCACGHTNDNSLTVPCLAGLQYKFRVTAVNRIGDSLPLVSDVISVSEGADSLVR